MSPQTAWPAWVSWAAGLMRRLTMDLMLKAILKEKQTQAWWEEVAEAAWPLSAGCLEVD